MDQVEQVARDSLRPWERNTRKHSDAQIERLQKSLAEFGFVKPIVVDEESRILAGHGVWMAAGAIDLEPKWADVAIARWEAFTGQEAVRG